MKLYLVQHAKAASKQNDPERPLTEQGLRDIRKVAAFIKSLDLCVDYLWHSGKKRALQTAEILAKVVRANTLAARDGLGPTDNIAALVDELASATADIMIVGHLPFLARLASVLLTGSESAQTVAFQRGGIVCMNRSDDNQWQIDWMLVPELLS